MSIFRKIILVFLLVFTLGVIFSRTCKNLHVITTAQAQEDEDEGGEDGASPVRLTPTPSISTAQKTPTLSPTLATSTPSPTIIPSVVTSQPTTSTQSSTPSSWPWYITRAAGITSLILLSMLVLLGLGITTGVVYRIMGPIPAWTYHRLIGIALVFSIATHLIALLFEKFINFNISEILIPFTSTYKPLFVGLGGLAFYAYLLVIITSIWFIKKYKSWRLLHYLSFVMFTLIIFHSFYTGTDTRTITMEIIYAIIILTFAWLFSLRVLKTFKKK